MKTFRFPRFFSRTFLFSAVASLSFATFGALSYLKQLSPDYFSFQANRPDLIYSQGEIAHLVVHPKAVELEPGQRLYFDMSSTLPHPLSLRRLGQLLTVTVDMANIGSHTFTAKAFVENSQSVDDNLKAQENVADKIDRIEREFTGRQIPIPVQNEKSRLLALQGALQAQLAGLRTLVQEKNLTLEVQGGLPVLNFALESQVIDEGVAGSIQVGISYPMTEDLLVEYTVSGTSTGPAGPDADHDLASGSILIPASSMSAQIPVEITADALHEGTETVVVTLSANPAVNMGARLVHKVVIRDMTPSFLSVEIESNGAPVYGILRLGSSQELIGKVAEFEIDFGDGSPVVHMTAAEFNYLNGLKHLFCPGNFIVKVTPIGFEGERLPTVERAFDLSGTMRPIPRVSVNEVVGEPLQLEFDASLSTDPVGGIVKYGWTFGDGTAAIWSETPVTVHEFPNVPGLYPVQLTLIDNKMGVRRSNLQVEVTALTGAKVSSVPVPVINMDKILASAPATFTFDASQSFSVSGNPIVTYRWIFDDQQYDSIRLGMNLTRTFQLPGAYTGTLVLIDSAGNEARESFDFFVDDGTTTPASSDIVVSSVGNAGVIDQSPLSFRGLVDPAHRYWKLDPASDDMTVGSDQHFSVIYPPHQDWVVHEIKMKAIDIYGNTHTVTQAITMGDSILTPQVDLDIPNEFGNTSFEFDYDAASSANTDGNTEIRWGFEDGSSWIDGLFSVYSDIKKYFSGRNGHFGTWVRLRNETGLGSSQYAVVNVANGVRPTPSFTLSHAVGFLPLTVTADGTLSTDGDDPIDQYFWNFQAGEGGIRHGLNPSYTYTSGAGLKHVELMVRDEAGRVSGSVNQSIYLIDPSAVPPGNTAPVADLVISNQTGNLVEFDASGSTDDTQIVVYEWDFGDGVKAVTFNEATVSHEYQGAGSYTVKVTVTDEHGAQDEVAILVLAPLISSVMQMEERHLNTGFPGKLPLKKENVK